MTGVGKCQSGVVGFGWVFYSPYQDQYLSSERLNKAHLIPPPPPWTVFWGRAVRGWGSGGVVSLPLRHFQLAASPRKADPRTGTGSVAQTERSPQLWHLWAGRAS